MYVYIEEILASLANRKFSELLRCSCHDFTVLHLLSTRKCWLLMVTKIFFWCNVSHHEMNFSISIFYRLSAQRIIEKLVLILETPSFEKFIKDFTFMVHKEYIITDLILLENYFLWKPFNSIIIIKIMIIPISPHALQWILWLISVH